MAIGSPAGNIYGVALNDRAEREMLAEAFGEKPYAAPPQAPVVYMKPRVCLNAGTVALAPGEELVAAPTLAVLLGRAATRIAAAEALAHVGAVCLAIDLFRPQASYYRPAVAQKNGEGFLPLGGFVHVALPCEIRTVVDGREAHRWTLDRLVRPVATLISDLSAFMTLQAGDLLLVGLPGDAPSVRAGQAIRVEADGLPTLHARIGGRA